MDQVFFKYNPSNMITFSLFRPADRGD